MEQMKSDTAWAICRKLWDPEIARFTSCGLLSLTIISLASIILIFGLSFLGNHLKPKGSAPFFADSPSFQSLSRTIFTCSSLALVALALTAMIAQTVLLIHSNDVRKLRESILTSLSWFIVGLYVMVKRPRRSPNALLLFLIPASAVEISYLTTLILQKSDSVCHYVSLVCSMLSIAVIFSMPYRFNPGGEEGISAVGSVPSDQDRSPEDSISLWQFLSVQWMHPLIALGKKRKLNDDDIWRLPFDFQHRRLFDMFREVQGSVITRLLRANSFDITFITILALIDLACDFANPLLLQQLLKAMEDKKSPRSVAVTYAALNLFVSVIKSQEEMLMTWFGRRCYERSRGEMIMMVYDKALSRKNFSGATTDNKKGTNGSTGTSNGVNGTAKQKPVRSWLPWRNKQKEEKKPVDPASMGKVLNIIRGDVYEVAQRFWEIQDIVTTPLGIIVAGWLIWKILGPSCFLAILAVFLAQVVTAYLTKYQIYWTTKRKAARDERLQVSSQYIEVIRHLRWYGWQSSWLEKVFEVRQKELWIRIRLQIWFIIINVVNAISVMMFPVIALATYTLLDGHELRIDIIFPALQIFNMMTTRLRDIPPLINTLTNAYVASTRIQTFMVEPEKEVNTEPIDDTSAVILQNCSFCWPEATSPVLSNIDLTIEEGLTVVTGKVGSGKTALLQALLGEMDRKSGSVKIPIKSIGYCAQTPWLQSMSLRDNILFFSPYDPARYRDVLDTCELLTDFANFKNGDLSFIGENGIGLSGGQKARVALARAIYSPAPVLLLDDPLSALDHSTAELIAKKLFLGALLHGRIVVLVTHRMDVVQGYAKQIIEVDNGTASRINNVVELLLSGENEREPSTTSSPASEQNGVAEKFIEDEYRADWGIQARVYWTWIKAGKFKWWVLLMYAMAQSQVVVVAQRWFLKTWGEAYDPVKAMFSTFSFTPSLTLKEIPLQAMSLDLSAPFKNFPAPAENVRPWILTFFFINLAQNITLIIYRSCEPPLMYACSKTLFESVMRRVSGASFRYYDVTPIGRLMNRLTSDVGNIDGNILHQFERILFDIIRWVFSAVVIATVTPSFLVFSIVLIGLFVYIFLEFLPTSQSLRRLETVSLSPLFANFGELLQGLTTVRAFHAQKSFQDRVISVVDRFQAMDHFYWSLQAWLQIRYNILSSLSTFVLTAIALYSNLSPGLTAFTLLSSNQFVSATNDLCRRYGQLQMDFVSVERVEELLHIDQEPPGTIHPPAAWPAFRSAIEFDNVTIRYAPHLDPAVTDVSLTIPSGSTTCVMGRTGSGKSTLVASILAVVRASSGRILIDGIDVAEVDVDTLRRRVTFVAQEPVLFSGSIRHNLDPLKEYSDEECTTVLERVCSTQGWALDTHIDSGGRNISQGQRQLIGITRAVLRRSPVVILDEATASVDLETSLEIQRILREEMQGSTLITIAHRLEAVEGADYAILMDHGKVIYQGPAANMPRKDLMEEESQASV